MNLPNNIPFGGGSLLVAWQLKEKNVLIVGGGEVASQRLKSVLVTDAYITILSPAKNLHPMTKLLIEQHPARITYFDRRFSGPAELHNMDMVLTALDDSKRSGEIVDLCRKSHIPVNAADIPNCCDFYFGAQIRDGPLQIMISTNGNGPRMASLVKAKLESSLSGNEGAAITNVGLLRDKLKERAPGVGGAIGRQRMKWMTQLCNAWRMEDFCLLDVAAIDNLLDIGWNESRVPTAQEILGKSESPSTIHPGHSFLSLAPLAIGFTTGVMLMGLFSYIKRR